VFIYHVRGCGPILVSGGLSQCTNAVSYMDVSNYHGNWFLRIVWSLCENCVLYFLLSHCQNKELFPMLTSLNGTFAAAVLMRLPFLSFLFFFCFDFESMLRASSFVLSFSRHDVVPSNDFQMPVCGNRTGINERYILI